jgi:hypothetical protein
MLVAIERILLFPRKKKQKDFFSWGCIGEGAHQDTKVFWFFFSKKTMLPSRV